MEGKAYQCCWKKTGRQFFLWLKADENLRVAGKSFDEAAEAISEMIAEKYGDGEAVKEFSPPPPTEHFSANWMTPRILMLGCNEAVATNLRSNGMFEGDFCDRCGSSIGQRTDQPAILLGEPRGDICFAGTVSPNIRFVSERFLALLPKQDLDNFELRPVQAEVKLKQKYYELRGRPIASWVSFTGAKQHPITCWRCPKCQRRNLWPNHPNFSAYGFVARKALPTTLPGCFVLGDPTEGLTLCMKQEQWDLINGRQGTKGIKTANIGIVPDSLLVSDPALPEPPQ